MCHQGRAQRHANLAPFQSTRIRSKVFSSNAKNMRVMIFHHCPVQSTSAETYGQKTLSQYMHP